MPPVFPSLFPYASVFLLSIPGSSHLLPICPWLPWFSQRFPEFSPAHFPLPIFPRSLCLSQGHRKNANEPTWAGGVKNFSHLSGDGGTRAVTPGPPTPYKASHHPPTTPHPPPTSSVASGKLIVAANELRRLLVNSPQLKLKARTLENALSKSIFISLNSKPL